MITILSKTQLHRLCILAEEKRFGSRDELKLMNQFIPFPVNGCIRASMNPGHQATSTDHASAPWGEG
jgi:hypothetical protein